MVVKRRKLIVVPQVVAQTSDTVTLTLTYSGAAPATAATFNEKKYNKNFAINFQQDDGDSTNYNVVYAYMNGGVPAVDGTTYPGLTYTDGAGGTLKAKGSFALPARTDRDGSNSGQTSYAHYIEMLANGWGIMNHAHGPDTNDYADRQNWIQTNEQAIYDATGFRPSTLVPPSADEGFSVTGKNLGYKATYSQFGVNASDGQNITWGSKLPLTKEAGAIPLFLSRYYLGDDWSQTVTVNAGKAYVDEMFSNAGKCICMFVHGVNGTAGLNGFKTFMQYLFNHTSYADNVWFADSQEIIEFYDVINKAQKSEVIAGNTKTITVNLSALDKNTWYKDFCLNAGTGLTNVTATGVDNVTFNTSTGLINVYKKNSVFTNPSLDTVPARILAMTAYSNIINLEYDKPVTQSLTAGYTVTSNTVTGISGSGTVWQLTLGGNWATGQRLTYKAQNGDARSGNYYVGSYIGYVVSQGALTTGQIPFSADNLYQVNAPAKPIDAVFSDTRLTGTSLEHAEQIFTEYDNIYNFPVGMDATISSFKWARDYRDQTGREMKIYGTNRNTGVETLLWTMPTNTADGVEQTTNITSFPAKSLRIHVKDNGMPLYVHWFGTYKPLLSVTIPTATHYPIKNQFGAVAQTYDLLLDRNTNDKSIVPVNRLPALRNFAGGFRVYIDWETLEPTEGLLNFNPTTNGGYYYDNLFATMKAENRLAYFCLKTIPAWKQNEWPIGHRNNENAPVDFPANSTITQILAAKSIPANYTKNAKLGFQIAARYGRTVVASNLLTVNTVVQGGYQGAPQDQKKTALNTLTVIENGNEEQRFWKGEDCYQSGAEYAANMSAFYDGHKNTMGAGVGVKNADPTMLVAMGGMADVKPDYLLAIVDWCKVNRGFKSDGSVDIPFDIIIYHNYIGNGGTQFNGPSTAGIPMEASTWLADYDKLRKVAYLYMGGMPIWCNESGYDLDYRSYQRAVRTNDITSPILDTDTQGQKDAKLELDNTPQKLQLRKQAQADWTLRGCLMMSERGQQYFHWYQVYDQNSTGSNIFDTMGLLEIQPNNADTRRGVVDYWKQVTELMGDYLFSSIVSNPTYNNTNAIVHKYTLGSSIIYVLWKGSYDGTTTTYNLPFTAGTNIQKVTPLIGSDTPTTQNITTTGTFYTVAVSETPVFVKVTGQVVAPSLIDLTDWRTLVNVSQVTNTITSTQATSASASSYAISGYKIPAGQDGYVQMTLTAVPTTSTAGNWNGTGEWGLDGDVTATNPDHFDYTYGHFVGLYYKISGAQTYSTVDSLANGNLLRIRVDRTLSKVFYEYSTNGGTSWIEDANTPCTNIDYFIKVGILFTAWKCTNLKGYNVTVY